MSARLSDPFPLVSILVPTMNEENNVGAALAAIAANHYPVARLQVVVVDGGSHDQTLSVVGSFSDQLPLKVIVEKGCTVYRALNLGLANASGDVVLRVDARSQIPENYIRTCVAHLSRGDIKGVGGVQEQYGLNSTGEAIAIATAHPLGVGGAAFRVGRRSGFVDTVYLGCYPRDVFEEIGQFDDDGRVVSEDSMFNKRLRDKGGKIFLDHTLRVKYPAKTSIAALVRQYFIYGGARAHVWLKYGVLTSKRQLIPILFSLGLIAMALVGLWHRPALLALFVGLGVYGVTVLVASLLALYMKGRLILLGKLMLAFGAIHFAWPAGFFLRIITPSVYFRLLSAPRQGDD